MAPPEVNVQIIADTSHVHVRHSRNIWCHLEGLWMDAHGADADADQAPVVLDTTGIRLKAENPAR